MSHSVSAMEVKARYAAIQAAIEALNGRIRRSFVGGTVFEVPLITEGMEGRAPESIHVNKVEGVAALELALSAYTKFERVMKSVSEAQQHPGSVFRLPGWIAVKEDLGGDIEAINALKIELDDYLKGVPEKERPKFNRETLPRVAMLQLRRIIPWLPAPLPYSLVFTWLGQQASTKLLTAEQACNLIDKAECPPDTMSRDDFEKLRQKQRRRIVSVPAGAQIIWRKPIAPHPGFDIVREKGQTTSEHRKVSLPVLVHCEGSLGDWERRVRGLGDYNARIARLRKQRKDAAPSEPLVQEMNLYWRRLVT